MERKKPPIRAHATRRAEDFLLERLLDDGFRRICKRSNLARRKQTSGHIIRSWPGTDIRTSATSVQARDYGGRKSSIRPRYWPLSTSSHIFRRVGAASGGDEDRMAAEKVAREKGQA